MCLNNQLANGRPELPGSTPNQHQLTVNRRWFVGNGRQAVLLFFVLALMWNARTHSIYDADVGLGGRCVPPPP